MPGNMFVASCRFVRKLLPLAPFQERMQQLETSVRRHLPRRHGGIVDMDNTAASLWKATLYPFTPMMVGTKRWNSEHWIGSHPAVRPCDLSPTPRLQPWHKKKYSHPHDVTQQQQHDPYVKPLLDSNVNSISSPREDYAWAMAPRHPITATRYELNLKRLRQLLHEQNSNNKEDRLREWFLLPGMLAKWNALYNPHGNISKTGLADEFVVPPASSWIWNWFPDGEYWKDRVEKYGLHGTTERI